MKTIITENLQKTQRYIPHTLETRLATIKIHRNKNSILTIMKKYLYHSNRLPIQTLGWLTPVEKRQELQRS